MYMHIPDWAQAVEQQTGDLASGLSNPLRVFMLAPAAPAAPASSSITGNSARGARRRRLSRAEEEAVRRLDLWWQAGGPQDVACR